MFTLYFFEITITCITRNGNVIIKHNDKTYLMSKKLFNRLLAKEKAEVVVSSIRVGGNDIPCFKHVQF